MNRKQKRDFVKAAKKRGIDEKAAEAYLKTEDAVQRANNGICEGDKVILDTAFIMSRKDYKKLVPEYREFIESSAGVVFTAHLEKDGRLASLNENDNKWLFWIGDLKKIKE